MPRRCVGAPNTFCSSLRFGILNPSHSETHGRIGRCPDVASGRPIPFVPHFVSESSILHTRRLMEGLGDAPTLRRGAQYLLFLDLPPCISHHDTTTFTSRSCTTITSRTSFPSSHFFTDGSARVAAPSSSFDRPRLVSKLPRVFPFTCAIMVTGVSVRAFSS